MLIPSGSGRSQGRFFPVFSIAEVIEMRQIAQILATLPLETCQDLSPVYTEGRGNSVTACPLRANEPA